MCCKPRCRMGRLRRHFYGVRNAGQNFELKVQSVREAAGAVRGTVTCASSRWQANSVSFLHRSDDFVIVGQRLDMNLSTLGATLLDPIDILPVLFSRAKTNGATP